MFRYRQPGRRRRPGSHDRTVLNGLPMTTG